MKRFSAGSGCGCGDALSTGTLVGGRRTGSANKEVKCRPLNPRSVIHRDSQLWTPHIGGRHLLSEGIGRNARLRCAEYPASVPAPARSP